MVDTCSEVGDAVIGMTITMTSDSILGYANTSHSATVSCRRSTSSTSVMLIVSVCSPVCLASAMSFALGSRRISPAVKYTVT